MKTFTLSKKDIAYLSPLDATMSALNVAIQVYVVGTVYKRLGIDQAAQARYDMEKGELYVAEASDKQKAEPVMEAPVTDPKAEPEEKKA